MPYEKTQSKLEYFVEEALSNEEIQYEARQADLEVDYLKYWFLDVGVRENAPRTWEAAAAEIEAYDQLEKTLQSNRLEERLKTAEQEVEKAVIEKGILPALRSIISAYFLPSYETSLTISDAPGPTLPYEVTTESKLKLQRLLVNMSGGSIGVTGPEGVGKTTLLSYFCSNTATIMLKGRPVLSVMTSVPADYNAREFLLHIFSLVCQRVVGIKMGIKGKVAELPWDYVDEVQPSPSGWTKVLASAVPSLLVGILLVVFEQLTTNPSSNPSTVLFGLGIFLVILGVGGLLIWLVQLLRRRRQTERRRLRSQTLYGNDPLVMEARDQLHEIKFQQSYSSGWAGSWNRNIASNSAETVLGLSTTQMSVPDIVDRYRDFLIRVSHEYEIIIGIDELENTGSGEQASRFLKEIQAVFGIASCFYLVSISENVLSSSEQGGSPFRAEFESFESFFDAIVRVDYLNLATAQRLLSRRWPGISNPFLDLCHCMAGGLPRDLIRVCRGLLDEYSQSGESHLSPLCYSLIKADLKARLRAATSIVAKKVDAPETVVVDLLERIRKIEVLLETAYPLPTICEGLLDSYTALLTSKARLEPNGPGEVTEGSTAARRDSLASLSTELGVYLHYSVTLLEFFGQEDLSPETLKAAEDSGVLDQLARARQSFDVSPGVADSIIADFRRRYNITIPGSDLQ